MITTDELRANVEAGAEWLDENFPGWWVNIDLGSLDLRISEFCICGQLRKVLTGDRAHSILRNDGSYTDDPLGFDWAFPWELGFNIIGLGAAAYRILDELWVEAIKKRWAGDA